MTDETNTTRGILLNYPETMLNPAADATDKDTLVLEWPAEGLTLTFRIHDALEINGVQHAIDAACKALKKEAWEVTP